MSGGATGISAHPGPLPCAFMPRLVFLGRTLLDPGINPAKPHPEHSSSEGSTSRPQGIGDRPDPGGFALLRVEATYHTCDVTDPRRSARSWIKWQAVMAGSTGSFTAPESSGRSLERDESRMNFSMVTDVKFLGPGIYSRLPRGPV